MSCGRKDQNSKKYIDTNCNDKNIYVYIHIFSIFRPHVVCRILVSHPGTESVPSAMEAGCLNHWTARDASICILFFMRTKLKDNMQKEVCFFFFK